MYKELDRFISEKDRRNIVDKKIDKQIKEGERKANKEMREQKRKEYIDKTIHRIMSIFKKERKTE